MHLTCFILKFVNHRCRFINSCMGHRSNWKQLKKKIYFAHRTFLVLKRLVTKITLILMLEWFLAQYELIEHVLNACTHQSLVSRSPHAMHLAHFCQDAIYLHCSTAAGSIWWVWRPKWGHVWIQYWGKHGRHCLADMRYAARLNGSGRNNLCRWHRRQRLKCSVLRSLVLPNMISVKTQNKRNMASLKLNKTLYHCSVRSYPL